MDFCMPGYNKLSITNSQNFLKLMSIELLMPSNPLILCHLRLLPPSSFPASGSFPVSQFFASGGQNIGASASVSVLPMNIQDWFPLGWTGWISLQSKGLSNTTVQKHQFFSAQLPLWSKSHIHTWYWKNHSFDQTDFCRQSNVSAILIYCLGWS